MKNKILFAVLFFTVVTVLSSSGASYKINTSGNIKSQDGQTTSPTQTNYFNNYSANSYTANKTVLKNPIGTIDIVMDYSGSMASWINIAKQAMSNILSQLPDSVKIGFRTFGEDTISQPATVIGNVKKVIKDKKGYKVQTESPVHTSGFFCDNTRSLVKVIPKSSHILLNAMNSAQVGGSTPLTLALQQAAYVDFQGMSQANKKKIILITDGGENCGGDPCAFAKQLMRQRQDIVIDVVLVSSNSRELMCVAQTTGGKFHNVNDPMSFVDAIDESMTKETAETEDNTQNYEYVN